ncbi:GAF and ANTAR domain-containing protein [Arthrobacter sp. CDRTa11]|uniref:GAF and ANTAR domain-containing protein n=1 Tax=Arthrobacter sp. CDRTa11 TaxID=2651199 RepID=UPI002265AAA4|nr:GAF and ANTAR domain-containing protein [Arthrobacter sp. CDRTa11]
MNVPFSSAEAALGGPEVSVRAADGARTVYAALRPTGIVLDLVTGADCVTDSLQILVNQAAAAMGRTTGAPIQCGLILQRIKRATEAIGTDHETESLARLDQKLAEGPLTQAIRANSPIAVNCGNAGFNWPRYGSGFQAAGFSSVLGVPLKLGEGSQSAIGFFARSPDVFPVQVMADALAFADLASRSLKLVLELKAARAAASDLRSALESRTSIDIACGVIMAQNRCSYHDAIGIISRASSHRNIKLRKIAEGILDRLPGGTPRTHFDH